MNIKEQKDLWGNPNMWSNDGHEWSVYFGTTDNLWNILYPKIEKYLKGEALEIAPGYGRITKYILEKANNLSIVDLNSNCIEKCKEKFGDKIKSYTVNDGKTLNYIDDSFDFVFSYDSFVHMTADVIECYLIEIERVLKPNGYAFIHHSYFFGSEDPTNNIAGRSNMTNELFSNLVKRYDMTVLSQESFRVSEQANDTITIFQKNNV
jgi:ubiquinone/menaquinone biosynthesis C-methylase UbiE